MSSGAKCRGSDCACPVPRNSPSVGRARLFPPRQSSKVFASAAPAAEGQQPGGRSFPVFFPAAFSLTIVRLGWTAHLTIVRGWTMIKRRLGPDPHAYGAQTAACQGCPDILELESGDFAIIG